MSTFLSNLHNLSLHIQDNAKALVKKHVRSSKYDPCVEECEIITANPNYAEIRTASGKEQTVSLRDLAPLPESPQEPCPHPPYAHMGRQTHLQLLRLIPYRQFNLLLLKQSPRLYLLHLLLPLGIPLLYPQQQLRQVQRQLHLLLQTRSGDQAVPNTQLIDSSILV